MSQFIKQGDTYTNGEFIIHVFIQIGNGAYGAVYECTQVNRKETLCAEIIRSQGSDSIYLKRETDIINTLRREFFNNQNLVKVYLCQYQTFENHEILIIVMEKCVSNLEDELAKKGTFTSEEVINILKQLLNGYKPLYEKAILHHDIRPQNILISYDFLGKPIYKLAVFVIGKICKNNDITMTKLGTPVYAAPELYFLNDVVLDKALQQLKKIPKGKSQIDVYSIGIMLYQLLFGQPPFGTKCSDEVRNFQNNLKYTPFRIQDKSTNINNNLKFPPFRIIDKSNNIKSNLQELIEQMIVYNPMARIKFYEIYSNKLISIEPQKIEQPQPQPQPNWRFVDPPPSSFKHNFPPPRFSPYIPTSTSSDNNKQTSFQSTPIQQQAQMKQIQIDDINDSQNYLKTLLSENSLLFSKDTINQLRESLESIQQFNQKKINTNSVKLMQYFKYEENGSYSLGFLKFYYCLIIRANKKIIKKEFNSEQELQQEIVNILEINDHNVY